MQNVRLGSQIWRILTFRYTNWGRVYHMAPKDMISWTFSIQITSPSPEPYGFSESLVRMKRLVIPHNVAYTTDSPAAKAGLRNNLNLKPTYIPTQYSVDWANVVTGYMKKQLVEIALPSAPRLGLNIKQTFKGVLADSDTRDRWMSRFTYWCAASVSQK
jgi:hypothetical protein